MARVSPSLATPHQMQKDNRILVRVGSECRDPDLATLRSLFDRESQQERRIETLATHLFESLRSINNHMMIPTESGSRTYPPRFAPGSHRVSIEWMPLDAPTELVSFWTKGNTAESPDQDMLVRLGKAGWYVQGMSQDDMVFLSRGLGLVAIFTRKPLLAEVDMNANPVDVIYLDASGALIVDVPTASLGAEKPDRFIDCTPLIERLVKRVDQASTMLCTLLHEQGYGGRLQVRVRVNTGMGYDLSPRVHTGSTMISVTDDLDTVRNALVPMLCQMTRSWLGYPFMILRWNGKEPIITSL